MPTCAGSRTRLPARACENRRRARCSRQGLEPGRPFLRPPATPRVASPGRRGRARRRGPGRPPDRHRHRDGRAASPPRQGAGGSRLGGRGRCVGGDAGASSGHAPGLGTAAGRCAGAAVRRRELRRSNRLLPPPSPRSDLATPDAPRDGARAEARRTARGRHAIGAAEPRRPRPRRAHLGPREQIFGSFGRASPSGSNRLPCRGWIRSEMRAACRQHSGVDVRPRGAHR